MDADVVDDNEHDNSARCSSLYLTLFRRHLAEFRAHLTGDDGQLGSASYIPPTGYWTSREKDAFFHALSVHSRLRPDLIAAELEHKTVVDVCAYIDVLAEAPLSATRRDLDIAMEVSDDWLEVEETQGAQLNSLERHWETVEKRQRHDAAIEEEHFCVFSEATDSQDVEQRLQNFATWREERERVWEREHAFGVLEEQQLRALERIFWQQGLGSVDGHIPSKDLPGRHDILGAEQLEPMQHSSQPTQPVAPPPPRSDEPSDLVIDPLLLAESAVMLQNLSNMPVAESMDATPCDSTEADLATTMGNLSPRSRRRLQKRLHMRKQRAARTGKDAVLGVEKINPGKPKKRLKTKSDRRSKAEIMFESDIESEVEDEGTQVVASTSGFTERPVVVTSSVASKDRTKDLEAILHDQSIGIPELHAMDLDLFNLAALAKMMRLYRSIYDDAENTEVNSSMSADVIRLLHRIIVEFITEALHRSIVSRDQESVLKNNIKVWRRHEDDKELITPFHIEHALELMAVSHLSKEDLFGKFFDTPNENSMYVDEEEEEEEESDGDDHGEAPTSDDIDASVAGEDDTGQIASDDMGRNTRAAPFPFVASWETRLPILRPPQLSEGDQCMTDDMEEDALDAELEDEEDLDKEDRLREEKYQNELWAMGFA